MLIFGSRYSVSRYSRVVVDVFQELVATVLRFQGGERGGVKRGRSCQILSRASSRISFDVKANATISEFLRMAELSSTRLSSSKIWSRISWMRRT